MSITSVVIGTTPVGRAPLFTAAIAEASLKYPGLRISMIESSYEQLIRGLRSGEVDFVLGVLRPQHLSQGLKIEPIFTDRLAIFVRGGHSLAKKPKIDIPELLDAKWILPRPNALGRPLFEATFHSLGYDLPTPTVETGDLATIRQLLDVSDMLAVTSPHQLMYEIRSGSVVELPVSLPQTHREVGIITREGSMLSPAAVALLETLPHTAYEGAEAAPLAGHPI